MERTIIVATEGVELPDSGFYYVIGKNGVFFHKKTGLIEALVRVDGVPDLVDVKTMAKFNLPTIPIVMLDLSYAFAKIIYDRYQTESKLFVLFNKKLRKYDLFCPGQTVDPGGVHYDALPHIKDWLAIGSIHSHADMEAFHSSIDTHDEEKFDGFHITFGDLNSGFASLSMELAVNGNRFQPDLEGWIPGITKRQVKEKQPVKSTQLSFNDQFQDWPDYKEIVKYAGVYSPYYKGSYTRRYDPLYEFMVTPTDSDFVMKNWFDRVRLNEPESKSFYVRPALEPDNGEDIEDWEAHIDKFLTQNTGNRKGKFSSRQQKQRKGVIES